ncbi:MAG: hypothetical protein GJ676_06945 [Rhodobacteraceae bacterium]|nr:hypothetical protein [Paracoccaceae bacterium]
MSDAPLPGRVLLFRVILPRACVWAVLLTFEQVWRLPMWLFWPLLLADGLFLLGQARWFQHSADNHLSGHGSQATIWGGYLVLLFAALGTAALWWGTYLHSQYDPDADNFAERMDRMHAEMYHLTVAPGGQALVFKGTITFGLIKKAQGFLEKNPTLTRIELHSEGGHIYEARGMAQLIRKTGLDTEATGPCNSACTLLFIAGQNRRLGPEGSLGFHQYALEYDTDVLNLDPAAEQVRDRAFFAERGVSQDFLERMYDSPSTGLWQPTRAELLAAGVVTE